MVRSVNGSNNSAPIKAAPARVDLSASLAKNFTKGIISAAKNLAGGGGAKLQIAAVGRHSSKA